MKTTQPLQAGDVRGEEPRWGAMQARFPTYLSQLYYRAAVRRLTLDNRGASHIVNI